MRPWDKQIVQDMREQISRIESAIAGKDDHELVRPMWGDARLKSVRDWKASIAQRLQWIADIERGA